MECARWLDNSLHMGLTMEKFCVAAASKHLFKRCASLIFPQALHCITQEMNMAGETGTRSTSPQMHPDANAMDGWKRSILRFWQKALRFAASRK